MDLTPIFQKMRGALSSDVMRATVNAYLASWENSDPAARRKLFTEGAFFEDPVGAYRFEGLDAITNFWVRAAGDGVHISPRLHRTVVCGLEAIAHFTLTLSELDGTRTEIEVFETFLMEESGKIAGIRAFWDETCVKTG